MKLEVGPLEPKLRLLPVAVSDTEQGLILSRGAVEVRLTDRQAVEALQAIAARTAGGGATQEEIVGQFAAPDQHAAERLVKLLIERRFLVAEAQAPTPGEAEPQINIFYWQLGTTRSAIDAETETKSVAIVGVNLISRRLAAALAADTGFQVAVVDYPLLANLRLYGHDGTVDGTAWDCDVEPRDYKAWSEGLADAPIDCLVATSDFGGLHLMRPWNSFCVENDIHFMPVVLQDLVGYVGPLVVPGETACFECARGRENSNLANPEAERAAEARAFEEQRVAGLHPAMPNILGEIAAVELAKFYGNWLRIPTAGMSVDVNLLSMEMTPRYILKLPRCPVCSPLLRHAPMSLERNPFMPGNDPDQ